MSTYTGLRSAHGDVTVQVDELPLPSRTDVRNHSPTGFEWGYGGSGPAQLALAVLADHCGDESRALQHYQQFKQRVIAELRGDSWTLTSAQVDGSLKECEHVVPPQSPATAPRRTVARSQRLRRRI